MRLAIAHELIGRFPGKRIVLLEKEVEISAHQTGHNSGVVHSGVYYKPGSHKANLTRRGVALLRAFCMRHDIALVECGKVIVASDGDEARRLSQLYKRSQSNGVPGTRIIDADELREIEPNAAGVMALHSPATGIVDYRMVSRKLAELLRQHGAKVLTKHRVTKIAVAGRDILVAGTEFELRTRFLINAAGLHSDRVARMAGIMPNTRIIPFRGEYYLLRPENRGLVKGLIYPVPDPSLPFLGVHFTTTVSGDVEAGPNAVLALAREGYTARNLDLRDLAETLSFSGFWRLARTYWPVGLYEVYRSAVKAAFVKSLKKLVPAVSSEHLAWGHAGVRAQAVGRDGQLIDDFILHETHNSLHVLNAPSPAATASLAIGEHIVSVLESRI